ncbi:MAG: hypothetical protein VB013_04455 [Anaerolineaceae bacterium]|nr:hypothetical protein [Anaerolineaceae bacterium]
MPARKRFSAFDDLSNNPSDPAKIRVPDMVAESVETPQVERIERLKPSQMRPDRFQPRRLLPPSIRQAFYTGKINCYQAALEWLDMAQNDAGSREEVDRLLAMGSSFSAHGQIKSITGSWTSNDKGEYVFQIETGERRFWAACLQYASSGEQDEPLLRVEVVEHPTRQRQVLENRHAEPPSAVEQACEVASLILADMQIAPTPDVTDDYEFFRMARNQRMPNGLWERLMPIMQLTRPRMVQLLNILQLPSAQLDIADRYRLSERVLREVLATPRDQWERMIRLAIQNQLTSDEVAEIANTAPAAETKERRPGTPILPEPGRQAARTLRRFVTTMTEMDDYGRDEALDEIADTLVGRGNAEDAADLLEELLRLIRARLDRN